MIPSILTGCPPVPDGDYEKFGFSSADHVLLQQDLRQGRAFDGRPNAFPWPEGMSGSPVYAWLGATEKQTQGFVVVGVFIEYRKAGKLFVATDVGWVLQAISQLNEAAKAKWHKPPRADDGVGERPA
ncbi:hypothetical protein JJB11_19910 [Ramlibacter ginsenosidimutans]|uniref:Uncharacterized protein n=1 Tax=Ramlibacter ginsenosidimutans TaxID=502333 RepID=A0A934TVW9_9BURK|nr:hypothetical protein [Ramlibacter ginsenosidimutans]MBK6008378.1 hypothetical protein [Ramlibacter ginsenosidimutans]